MRELIAISTANALFGLALTVAAYSVAVLIWRRAGAPALLQPVLIATLLVAMTLTLLSVDYSVYSGQTVLVNELLGGVIVLMAVPLYRQFRLLRECGLAMVFALLIGSGLAISSALMVPAMNASSMDIMATLAPKSATAAVAVEISTGFGGIASLTAVVVISTGIFGAVFGPTLLRLCSVSDERAAGFALGIASHAIGTARAFQISEVAGAFASLGMILNAVLTILLVPVALGLLGH